MIIMVEAALQICIVWLPGFADTAAGPGPGSTGVGGELSYVIMDYKVWVGPQTGVVRHTTTSREGAGPGVGLRQPNCDCSVVA